MWKDILKRSIVIAHRVEKELKGKSADEKRAAFIKIMSEEIDLPFVPEWLENIIEPVLYGALATSACNFWNSITGYVHDFSSVELTPAQTEKAAGLIGVKINGEPIVPHGTVTDTSKSVDERIDELRAKYVEKAAA